MLLSAAILFLVAGGLLSLNVVQTSLARSLANRLNKRYAIQLNIQAVQANLWGLDVQLKGVYAQDYQQDTLFYASTIQAPILDFNALRKGDFNLGKVGIHGLKYKITTYVGQTQSNWDVFLEKLSSSAAESSSDIEPFVLQAAQVSIDTSEFKITDYNRENPLLFGANSLSLQGKNLRIFGPEVAVQINRLSFASARGIAVKNLSTQFSYSLTQMKFSELLIETQQSKIQGQLVLDYERVDFQDFYNKVLFHGDFDDSYLAASDINAFYPAFDPDEVFYFSTQIDGPLNDLQLERLLLNASATALRGDFRLKHLFHAQLPFQIEATLRALEAQYGGLVRLMPQVLGRNIPSSLERLGPFTMRGSAEIGSDMLHAKMNVSSSLGAMYTDLNLSNIQNIDQGVYQGFISLIDFDLGAYTQIPTLKKVSMDANIKGSGFLLNNLNTEVEGLVYAVELNNYKYIDGNVSGLFKNKRFEGAFTLEDPNCKFSFSGLADFTAKNSAFDFTALVDYADFHKMNLVQDTTALFKGQLDIDLKGTNIDNVLGVLSVSNTAYENSKDTYYFEDFTIAADSLVDGYRTLSINSPDIITGSIRGRYKLQEFGKLFQNAMGGIYTNYKPFLVTQGQEMRFEFNLYNTLIEIFYPEIQFSPNTFIRGALQADTGVFTLDFKSPHFSLFGNQLDSVALKVDSQNPLFNTFLAVKNVKTPYYDFEDLRLINNTLQDTLFFRTEFKGGPQQRDQYGFNFYHTFNQKKQSVLGLKKSEFNFKGSPWLVNPAANKNNKVTLSANLDSIFVSSLVLSTPAQERIVLNGQWADSTYKDIQLSFSKVALQKISPSIDSLKIAGKVNGELNILQKDNVYFPNSNLDIQDFEINGAILGDLDLDLLGNGDLTDFIVNAKLVESGSERLRLLGNVFKTDSSSYQTKLLASFDNFKLRPFSPLGENVIGDIRGGLWGNAEVSGPLSRPNINGELTLNNAGISVPYLGVNYDFSPNTKIALKDQSYLFKDIELTDQAFKTKAILSGSIAHSSFSNWELDLSVDTQSEPFNILHTQQDPEALYYGDGFLNGTGSIYGPTKALNIDVSGTTAAGTALKIPLKDVVSLGDYTFINFEEQQPIDLPEASKKAAEDYRGLELNFDLAVTPEAEVEIVVDPKSGSSLKGTGGGILLMEINTNGKFAMFGDFVVVSGAYNYKFGGFIDKTFKVKPGGNIVWDGDPMGAQLNMEASYSLFANPAPLLESTGYTQRIPTEVLVRLDGAIENPNIDFDIEFPGTNSVVKSELQYALQDPTVQDRNAFFLLAQGTFVNDATGINQQAVTGNLLQSASGLFSSILEGSNDKLNFGLSYEQGILDNASNLQTDSRIGVSVSTQLSDRVLFNGRLGVPVGGVTENVVAGNAEIQIILNDQGSLSAKIFNRENEIQQFLADRQGYTQGVGLSYQVDFNTFKELLEKITNRSKSVTK